MSLPLALFVALMAPSAVAAPSRPNILWLTLEDISPHVGAFGDTYAVTPNMDKLAGEGVRYTNAYAPIGVCAPARSSLILGMYAPTAGTQHMRSMVRIPGSVKLYSQVLKAGGYYTSNNSKEDYNLDNTPADAWDDSSKNGHWRNRPDKQKPFFSIFNFSTCHESQIRLAEAEYQKRRATLAPNQIHDPALAPLPPYHPDTPETRKDWARYADMITYTDALLGEVLAQLRRDGLENDTIVFLFSDHGAGMPRSKRWLYESSTRVPFMVRFGRNFRHLAPAAPGAIVDRLIDFTDLGPTALSLAGLPIPSSMRGHAFLGAGAAAPREHVFGFRDRMDERIDMLRMVRDKRYRLIRNYLPHRIYAQRIDYMYMMPTMQVWQSLYDQNKLRGPQKFFFQPKPPIELYDTWADPHEVNNLALHPDYADVKDRLSKTLDQWLLDQRDTGFLPEAEMYRRAGAGTPYELGQDQSRYDLPTILQTANLAASGDVRNRAHLVQLLGHADAAVRYWAATGLAVLGKGAQAAQAQLVHRLGDEAANVRIAAAEALLVSGASAATRRKALETLQEALSDADHNVVVAVSNVLSNLGKQALSLLPAVQAAADTVGKGSNANYAGRILPNLVKEFSALAASN